MAEINEIIIALKAQGFTEFAQKAGLPVLAVKSLAEAMESTGFRSAKALNKWRLAQEQSGAITKAFSLQLEQAIKTYNKFVSTLEQTPRQAFASNISTVSKQAREMAARRQTEQLGNQMFASDISGVKNKNITSLPAFADMQSQFAKFEGPKFDTQRLEIATKLQKELLSITNAQLAKTKDITQQQLILNKAVEAQIKLELFGRGSATTAKDFKRFDQTKLNGFNEQIGVFEQRRLAIQGNITATKKQNEVTEELNKGDNKYQQSLGIAIGKIIRYRAAFYTMRAVIQGTTGAIKTFMEIQAQLADLSKVIDPSASLTKFRDEAFRMAQQFGVTVSSVVDSYKIWAQAGFKQNEVLKATQATLIGVNAIGLDSLGVTEALTAAIFTYGAQIEDLVKIESKWLAVQREFPVSAADLANAVKIVGAAGETLGITLDSLAGFVSAMNAATRKSGIAVGQSLKTMFAEMSTKDSISVLEGVGVAVLKSANEFRDLDKVFDDLAKKWDTLDNTQKINIATTIAGTRRFSDFIAMMDNYSIKLRATAIAQSASNEALIAANLQVLTLDSAWKQAKAGVDEFAFSIGKFLEGGLGSLTVMFKNIIQSVGGVNSVLPKAIGSLIAFAGAFIAVGAPILGISFLVGLFKHKLQEASLEIEIAKTRIVGFNSAVVGAAGALKIFNLSNLITAFGKWNVAIAAFSIAMGIFTTIFAMIKKPVYENILALDDFTKSNERALSILRDHSNALETQQKLIEQIPQSFQAAIDSYKQFNIGTTGSKEAIQRMISTLSAVPQSTDGLVQSTSILRDEINKLLVAQTQSATGSKKLSSQNGEAMISTEQFGNAVVSLEEKLKSLSAQTKKNIEDTKNLIAEQIKLISEQLQQQIESKKGEVKRVQAIVNLDDDSLKKTVGQIDAGLHGGQIIVKARIQTFLDPKAFKEQITNLSKISDLEQRSKEKTFLEFQFSENQKKALGPLQDMIDLLEKRKKILSEQTTKVTGSADQTKALGLDVTGVESVIAKLQAAQQGLGTIFDNLRSEMLKNAEEGRLGIEDFSKASLVASNKIPSYLQLIQDALDLTNFQNKGNVVLIGIQNEITELQTRWNKLNGVIDNTSEFTFGTKVSKEATEAGDSLDKLKESFVHINSEYATLLVTTKHGVVPPTFQEFRFAKAQEFVKEAQIVLENYNKTLNGLSEKITGLKKLLDDTANIRFRISNDETVRTKLSTLVGEGLINDFSDLDKVIQIATDQLSKYQATQESISNKKLQLINLSELKQAFDILKSGNNILLSQEAIIVQTQLRYGTIIESLKTQQKLLSIIPDSELKVQQIELKRIAIQKEQNDLIAQYADTNEKRVGDAVESSKNAMQETLGVLEKMRDIRLDKIFAKIAENASLIKDAFAGAVGNIPTNILAGHQKRKDLAIEIHDLELQIREASREGNRDAVNEAKQRLDLAKKEMSTYQRGWFEIRSMVIDIFDTISQAFWKQLSDRFGELVSKISLGQDTVGGQMAKSMAVATTNLVSDWGNRVKAINDQYLIDLAKVYSDSLLEQQRLRDSNTITVEQVQKIPSEKLQQFPTIALQNMIDRFDFMNSELAQIAPGLASMAVQDSPDLKEFRIQIDRLNTIIGMQNDKRPVQGPPENKQIAALDDNTHTLGELSNTMLLVKTSLTVLAASFATGLTGSKNKGAQVGAGFGAAVGSGLFQTVDKQTKEASGMNKVLQDTLGSTIGTLVAGPLGTFLGGTLGGLFGGLFGGADDSLKQLPKVIEDNTTATNNNTLALKQLDKAIFNAPTGFNVPTFSGAGFGRSVSITIQGGDSTDIANKVRRILDNEYKVDVNSYGTRGYAR